MTNDCYRISFFDQMIEATMFIQFPFDVTYVPCFSAYGVGFNVFNYAQLPHFLKSFDGASYKHSGANTV